jgi:hypothetical protein
MLYQLSLVELRSKIAEELHTTVDSILKVRDPNGGVIKSEKHVKELREDTKLTADLRG